MDQVLQGVPFVTIYLDNILIHSVDEEMHRKHLVDVFQRITQAGLTLRGKKYHTDMMSVHYLGLVFYDAGMTPDLGKWALSYSGQLLPVSQNYASS